MNDLAKKSARKEKISSSKMLKIKSIIANSSARFEKENERQKPFANTYKFVTDRLRSNHNASVSAYDAVCLENLLVNRKITLVARFKEFMILDYVDEFFKRYYKNKEVPLKLPKIITYYKNYLKFFCKPFLISIQINEKLKKANEIKAQLYYKQNYENDKPVKKEKIPKEVAKIFTNSEVESIADFEISVSRNFSKMLSKEDLSHYRNPLNEDKSFLRAVDDFRLESIANVLANLEDSQVEHQVIKKFERIRKNQSIGASTTEKTREMISTQKSFKFGSLPHKMDTMEKFSTPNKTGMMFVKPSRLRKNTPNQNKPIKDFKSTKQNLSEVTNLVTGTATKFRASKEKRDLRRRKNLSVDVHNEVPPIYNYKDIYEKAKKKEEPRKSNRVSSVKSLGKQSNLNEMIVDNFNLNMVNLGKVPSRLDFATKRSQLSVKNDRKLQVISPSTANLKFSVKTSTKKRVPNKKIDFKFII